MNEDPRALVVEDAPPLLRLFERMLSMSGYVVVCAPDAETALSTISDPDDLAVAVLDLSLPGIGGVELAHALWARAPDLPVVFATGSAGPLPSELQGAGHAYRILHKPFLSEALIAAVEAARVEAGSASRVKPRGAEFSQQ